MKKVYILHGWSYDISKWSDLVNKLKNCSIDPILLSIPGLTEKLDIPWTIENYVAWLSEKLKDEKEIALLGHSNGGRIALEFTIKNPSKVKKLFLIDSAGIYHNDLKIRVKRIVFKYLAGIGKKVTTSESLKSLLYKFTRENDYNAATDVMKKTMQNLINHDLTEELEKVTVETNIIWGEKDKITPFKDGIIMNSKIKNSKLYRILGAKHSPQFTNVNEVVKIIYENI